MCIYIYQDTFASYKQRQYHPEQKTAQHRPRRILLHGARPTCTTPWEHRSRTLCGGAPQIQFIDFSHGGSWKVQLVTPGYIYIYVCIHTYVYMYTQSIIIIHMYVYTDMCVYMCVYMRICIYIYIYIHTHTYMCICMSHLFITHRTRATARGSGRSPCSRRNNLSYVHVYSL